MSNFLLKEIFDIELELENIGFDSSYRHCAADKYRYKNIKIFGLTPPQANILKQTALSLGTDCAVHREVITGKAEKSDVVLGGSCSELKKIADKLKKQPFKLSLLSEDIISFLAPQMHTTKLAGILNVTPDSFSDGGLYFKPDDAKKHLVALIEDGADMIDIGAESTRPFFEAVDAKEQITRLKPILDFIEEQDIKIPISIDTRSSEVADFVLNNGADFINDVSGFDFDNRMPDIAAKYNAGVIIQHSRGNTEDKNTYDNLVDDVYKSLNEKIDLAREKGLCKIIIDPGIGFGKTKRDNFILLDRFQEFYSLNCPVMIGVSRKSLLGNVSNDLKDSLSAALACPLIKGGVDYLRVHNVKLHKNLINLLE